MTDSDADGRKLPVGVKIVIGFMLLLFALYLFIHVSGALALKRALADLERDGRPMRPEQVLPPDVPDESNAARLYDRAWSLLRTTKVGTNSIYEAIQQIIIGPTNWQHDVSKRRQMEDLLGGEACREVFLLIDEATELTYRADVEVDAANIFRSSGYEQLMFLNSFNVLRMHWLRGRDPASAWRLWPAASRLAGSLKDQPRLSEQLARAAMVNMLLYTMQDLSADSPPPPDLSDDLDAWLASLEDPAPWIRALDGERIILGSWIFSRPIWEVYGRSWKEFRADVRWEEQLLVVGYEGFAKVHDQACYLRRMKALIPCVDQPAWSAEGAALRNRQKKAPAFCLMARDADRMLRRLDEKRPALMAWARVLRTGLAVLAFDREHGDYPMSLEELPVTLPAGARIDPFTGKPLLYRLEKDGFVLYSVGPDNQDNGGVPEDAMSSRSWDIVWQVRRK